jgi:CRP-like cAMP-binding protein
MRIFDAQQDQHRMNDATELNPQWEAYRHFFTGLDVPAKTILLREGEIARQAYYIQKGCLRLWFNDNGKDITFQFFFEGQGVSSMESFRTGRPSLFNIETLEPCSLLKITKSDFEKMLAEAPGFRDVVEENIYLRLEHYFALFLSRIRDTPEQRYRNLLRDHPEIVQRIPQHYIASYLGVTPVSLSRIRGRTS